MVTYFLGFLHHFLSSTETNNCGSFGCVDWNDDPLGWEKLGIGRMLVFMGLEGLVFYFIIALIELKVFQKVRYSASRLWGKVSVRPTEGKLQVSKLL